MRYFNILIAILSISLSIQAQYSPMVLEGATWIYNTDGPNESTFTWDQLYSGYHIKGDSIVNSTSYKKVYTLDFVNDNEGNLIPTIQNNLPYALMREDINEQKVYVKFVDQPNPPTGANGSGCIEYYNDGTEYLLYDFSLMNGDTIAECTGQEWIIEIEENISILGIITTQVNFFTYQTIGANADLFYNNALLIVVGGYNRELQKYCVTDNLIDCKLTIDELDSPTDVIDDQLANDITVYPNPATRDIYITSSRYNIKDIQLFSIDGESLQIGNSLLKNDKHVELNTVLKSGIYLLQITNKEGMKAMKSIIIQNE